MKIALVRARYHPHGGAERFATRALRAIGEGLGDSAEVTVVARRWDAGADEAARGLRMVRCDPFYVGSTWRDASFARAVHAVVARERFDLVQSHERIAGLPIYRAGDGVHAAWLERRARAASGLDRLGIALNPHHRYLVAAERAMFEHAALRAVIVNSEMVRREIVERFAIDPAKLVLVRNGVDVARFHPDARTRHRAPMRADLGIDDAAPVFVFVGSGFERKGVGAALAALARIDGAHLVIVGDDKRRLRFEAEAARLGVAARVRFAGGVSDPLPYLAMADAFVLPTLYDPFPNAALEALATGLPVITTDAAGVAELLDHGENGWVVGVGDMPALVDAMRDAAGGDATRRAALSRAARRSAEPFTLDALGSALIALYRRLLASV